MRSRRVSDGIAPGVSSQEGEQRPKISGWDARDAAREPLPQRAIGVGRSDGIGTRQESLAIERQLGQLIIPSRIGRHIEEAREDRPHRRLGSAAGSFSVAYGLGTLIGREGIG